LAGAHVVQSYGSNVGTSAAQTPNYYYVIESQWCYPISFAITPTTGNPVTLSLTGAVTNFHLYYPCYLTGGSFETQQIVGINTANNAITFSNVNGTSHTNIYSNEYSSPRPNASTRPHSGNIPVFTWWFYSHNLPSGDERALPFDLGGTWNNTAGYIGDSIFSVGSPNIFLPSQSFPATALGTPITMGSACSNFEVQWDITASTTGVTAGLLASYDNGATYPTTILVQNGINAGAPVTGINCLVGPYSVKPFVSGWTVAATITPVVGYIGAK
jgi:hypothetical protein